MTPELGGNPFAPYPHRPKPPPAQNARLPVQRLKAAGAPLVVVAEAERRWASADAVERQHAREAFDALTDEELHQQIVEMEFTIALEAALGEPKPDNDMAYEALYPVEYLAAAVKANHLNVEGVREWVEGPGDGHPADRALAMLVVERRRAETEQRKTVIEPLEARVRGD